MIHAGIEPVDLSVEKYFSLKQKSVDRKDPSKGFYYTYTEHFTKDVYLRAVSILKELQKKQQIQNNLQGHLSYLIADKVEDIKKKSFKEVAEDFSKMLSKYTILDNGRMIAADIKETE